MRGEGKQREGEKEKNLEGDAHVFERFQMQECCLPTQCIPHPFFPHNNGLHYIWNEEENVCVCVCERGCWGCTE